MIFFFYYKIVDPDLKILNINARYPGARNDSYIWSMSAVRRGMEFHFENGERRTWLIGKLFNNRLKQQIK